MDEPLTAAQIEVVQKTAEERAARVQAAVEDVVSGVEAEMHTTLEAMQAQIDQMKSQVATLQEAVTVLDGAALKAGESVAFTAASGKVLSAEEGGPKKDGDPFSFEGRSQVGTWESWVVTRGV